MSHLNGVGKGARWRERALHLGAALALGLVVIGGVAIWILVERGSL
ncbi:hypothetical protein [Paracoccus aminophilus]|nr:hypothetical protein [Paracoccus aminophilus]